MNARLNYGTLPQLANRPVRLPLSNPPFSRNRNRNRIQKTDNLSTILPSSWITSPNSFAWDAARTLAAQRGFGVSKQDVSSQARKRQVSPQQRKTPAQEIPSCNCSCRRNFMLAYRKLHDWAYSAGESLSHSAFTAAPTPTPTLARSSTAEISCLLIAAHVVHMTMLCIIRPEATKLCDCSEKGRPECGLTLAYGLAGLGHTRQTKRQATQSGKKSKRPTFPE